MVWFNMALGGGAGENMVVWVEFLYYIWLFGWELEKGSFRILWFFEGVIRRGTERICWVRDYWVYQGSAGGDGGEAGLSCYW